MVRITAFLGSPRRDGNTGQLVDKLLEVMKAPDIITEIVHLSDYKISGCKGCLSCSKTGKCSVRDDMDVLYPKIEQSDAFIFACPTYNYNITPEMKILLDRMFCYYRFKGASWTCLLGDSKKALLVGVCAGPGSSDNRIEEDNMGFTIQAMRLPLRDLGIKIVKELRYYNTKRYPVSMNEEFQKELLRNRKEFVTILSAAK